MVKNTGFYRLVSEIKLQKFPFLVYFIPKPDGHNLIKLSVVRKTPKYRRIFQHCLTDGDYFIHGEEKKTAVQVSSFCMDIGKSYNFNIISFLIGIYSI